MPVLDHGIARPREKLSGAESEAGGDGAAASEVEGGLGRRRIE